MLSWGLAIARESIIDGRVPMWRLAFIIFYVLAIFCVGRLMDSLGEMGRAAEIGHEVASTLVEGRLLEPKDMKQFRAVAAKKPPGSLTVIFWIALLAAFLKATIHAQSKAGPLLPEGGPIEIPPLMPGPAPGQDVCPRCGEPRATPVWGSCHCGYHFSESTKPNPPVG